MIVDYQPFTINENAIADNEIVAAVADKRICIAGIYWTSTSANTLTFKSGATALAGPMDFAALAGMVLPAQPSDEAPWFVTAKGAAFNLALTAAAKVAGGGIYYLR